MNDEWEDLPQMGRPAGELGAALASLVDAVPDSSLSALSVMAAARRPERSRRGWVIGITVAAALAAVTTVTAVVVNATSTGTDSAASAMVSPPATVRAAGSAEAAPPKVAESPGIFAGPDSNAAAAGAPESPGGGSAAAGGAAQQDGSARASSAASPASACGAAPLSPAVVAIVIGQLPDLEGPVPATADCFPPPVMGGAFMARADESNLPLRVLVFAQDPGICATNICAAIVGSSAQSRLLGDGGFEVLTPTGAGGAIVLDAAATVGPDGTVTGPPTLTVEQLAGLGQALAAALG